MKKFSLYSIFFWMAVNLYPYFTHDVGMESMWSLILYIMAVDLPMILLAILIFTQRGKLNLSKWFPWLESQKFWIGLFLSVQVMFLMIIIYTRLLGNYMPMRGAPWTAGLALSLGMYLMLQYRTGSILTNGIMGLLSTAFFMGSLEIPYQIVGKLISWTWVTPGVLFLILLEQVLLILPFCVGMRLYKIQPTLLTWLGLIAWATILAIWVGVYDYWSIGIWSPDKPGVLNTPINWGAYFMNKLYVVAFAVFTLGFLPKGRYQNKVIEQLDKQSTQSYEHNTQ